MSSDQGLKKQIEDLKKISLFKHIAEDHDAMENIANLFKTASLTKGSDVLEEGVYGDSLFIIKSGTVLVIKKTKQGDPYVVTELNADMNIFFGEVALLDPERRSATVRCKTDCEFYSTDKEQFTKFGDAYPGLGLLITREISRILCQRLRKSSADIVTLFDALVEEVEKSGGLQ